MATNDIAKWAAEQTRDKINQAFREDGIENASMVVGSITFPDAKAECEVVRGSTEFKQTLKLVFSDFYELLTAVAENDGDTLWYNDGTTGHEALIDLAYKYDDQLGDELQARLEKDCDFTH